VLHRFTFIKLLGALARHGTIALHGHHEGGCCGCAVSLCPGTVLDAPAAAVYQLSKGGQVVGVAISSEAAE